jgi:hypothetical protein
MIVVFTLSELNPILKFLSYLASVASGFLLGAFHIIRWSLKEKKLEKEKTKS